MLPVERKGIWGTVVPVSLRNETGMTLSFITYDIGLAYYVSDTAYLRNMANL